MKVEVDREFLIDCIKMSVRYCIGRHTISAVMHASEIIPYLECLNTKEKIALGKDINRTISDIINYRHNVTGTVEYFNAADKICNFLSTHKDINYENTLFHIDLNTGDVDIDKEAEYKSTLIDDIYDLIPWMEFSDYLLNKLVDVYAMIDGTIITYKCIKSYGINNNTVFDKYIIVENYLKNPYNPGFIDPEYIIKIQ